MVTDVIDVVAEFPVDRKALSDLLRIPDTYPRLFPGIGACDPLETVEGDPVVRFRVGTPATEIRTHVVRMTSARDGDSIELHCPAQGSFTSIRLEGDQNRTRVTVTFFAPARMHPGMADLPNSAVVDWAVRGLKRVADLLLGAPTSVVVNGEDAPLRRRADIARQVVAGGVLRTYRPDSALRQWRRLAEYGFNLAGGYASGAVRVPNRPAVVDAWGSRTFAEMHRRTERLAAAMAEAGLGAGDAVGILARNHGAMVETMVAAGKLGVDAVLLNTGLPARRIEEIVQRDRLEALFVDTEYDHLVQYLHTDLPRFRTENAPGDGWNVTTEDLIGDGHREYRKPVQPGRLVVLTSGTSGTPKGARRPHPKGFATVAALMSRIPLRSDENMLIPAPLFHTWGLAALQLSTAVRATVVLPDRFDAEECLRLVHEHRITTLIVVPIMVNRILDLPAGVRDRYDTSSLRIVASCGAPLAGATVLDFMDTYGDILYNVYGSTEVSWATIADPDDLRTSPTTAGHPPLGTRLGVLGPDRKPLPVGRTGRVFVGNHMLFDGYVNSAPPDEADGMLDTGDLGYLDATGKLFIAGRDDEMIISGGENVFPRPVEEALAHLPQVSEVAVVGVPDREYGQRLAAFVVKREGAGLDSDMVRNYVRHRLSRFSVPRDVTFLSALPRGETGKILKRMLVGAGGDPPLPPPALGTAMP
ncbi:AMP-binding protein [Nocardia jiangsuensis]|uniref:AMP-binding protein n=1 Tax=Nocardia jiangsuensis TaxID=1691563 RepID=A0ABV8DLW6_9NOCA